MWANSMVTKRIGKKTVCALAAVKTQLCNPTHQDSYYNLCNRHLRPRHKWRYFVISLSLTKIQRWSTILSQIYSNFKSLICPVHLLAQSLLSLDECEGNINMFSWISRTIQYAQLRIGISWPPRESLWPRNLNHALMPLTSFEPDEIYSFKGVRYFTSQFSTFGNFEMVVYPFYNKYIRRWIQTDRQRAT